MKAKILLINNGTGGLFGFRRELIEALCRDHEVVAIAKNTGNRSDLITLGCECVDVNIEYHGTNPLQELKLISVYKKHIREIKPDIVFTYTIKPNIYAGIACAQLKVPYIANITGLGTAVENDGLIQKITVPLYRYGLRKAQKVFFQNAENRDFMLKRHMVSGAYDLLPGSGVNLNRFQVLEYPHGETVDFTFISRIMKEKGIDQYLEAARAIHAKYPETHFHVYGKSEGYYESLLKKMNDEGSVIYHGYATDIPAVHLRSSCTIHPTYYPEGMSNVLLESAASGRPVITTDRSGCREAVDDGVTGYIIRPKDSADLIEKIEKFLALSWEERKQMGLAGRAKMEREFDRNIVVQKYLEEIKKIK